MHDLLLGIRRSPSPPEDGGHTQQKFPGLKRLRQIVVGTTFKAFDPVNGLAARRQQYVINKWISVPRINNGPLVEVRRIAMRF